MTVQTCTSPNMFVFETMWTWLVNMVYKRKKLWNEHHLCVKDKNFFGWNLEDWVTMLTQDKQNTHTLAFKTFISRLFCTLFHQIPCTYSKDIIYLLTDWRNCLHCYFSCPAGSKQFAMWCCAQSSVKSLCGLAPGVCLCLTCSFSQHFLLHSPFQPVSCAPSVNISSCTVPLSPYSLVPAMCMCLICSFSQHFLLHSPFKPLSSAPSVNISSRTSLKPVSSAPSVNISSCTVPLSLFHVLLQSTFLPAQSL